MSVAYGPRDGGGVALGSLDLLDPQRAFEIVAITAKIVGGMGETEQETWTALPHESFDVVIMNPPFTRATDHSGEKSGIPNPMFGAFKSDKAEQQEMSEATERLFRGTAAHGNAGEGSYFLVLANKKLRFGGTLGLVLPLSLISGDAWEECRKLIQKSYSGVVVVSIAGAKDRDCSFSADTGMAECLIVAQKTQTDEKRATFVVLSECPASTMAGRSAGEQISRAVLERSIRKLEDGPVGGTTIRFGDDVIGYALDAPLPTEGSWNIARVWDLELAQTAYQVMKMGRVWLPTMPRRAAVPIPVTLIGDVGQVGPHHRDIGEGTLTTTGGFRGPFEVRLVGANRVPTYPVLWSHEAQRERCMQFEAESEGVIRKASSVAGEAETNTKAERIWNSASHCHLNTDFRFNSQSTAMQFSARPTMGGRAWPSIKLANQDQEKALTAWGNTSLGILMHWWHANKQQSGRGSVPITALKALPVLDVTKLSKETLARAVAIFDAMKQRELRPVNEIDRDPARSELDTRLATEVLGFPPELAAQDGPLALLRQKLALEPSINGGKLSS